MKKEEIMYCIKVHKEVVLTQVLDKDKLRIAHNLIKGLPSESLVSPSQARQIIYSWYTHHAKQFLNMFEEFLNETEKQDWNSSLGIDTTETSIPNESDTLSVNNDDQSHSEDVNYVGVKVDQPTVEELESELQLAQEQLETDNSAENRNVVRILKMRITKLKNKL